MKTSKWLKWKIGLFSTVGMAILFHQVKIDPTFELAVAKASTTAPDPTTQIAMQQDPITNQLDTNLNANRQNSNYNNNQGASGSSSDTMTSGRSHVRTARS